MSVFVASDPSGDRNPEDERDLLIVIPGECFLTDCTFTINGASLFIPITRIGSDKQPDRQSDAPVILTTTTALRKGE